MGWAGTEVSDSEVDTGAGVLNRLCWTRPWRLEGRLGGSWYSSQMNLHWLGWILVAHSQAWAGWGPRVLNYASASALEALSSCILLYINLPASSVSYLFKPFSILLRWCTTTIITNSAHSIKTIKFSRIHLFPSAFWWQTHNCWLNKLSFGSFVWLVFQAFSRSEYF